MGEIEIAGKDALAAVQHITSNDASKLQVGQAQYSGLMTPEGTFVDDVLVYRFGRALPARRQRRQHRQGPRLDRRAGSSRSATSPSSTPAIALRADRAPGAGWPAVLQTLTGVDLAAIKYYWFAHGEVAGVRGTISRTGYTGEDGFEIFVPPQQAEARVGCAARRRQGHGSIPCGLGARDTLRLEAGMRLYGNDMDDTTTVLEADLNWIVGWKKARRSSAPTCCGRRRRGRRAQARRLRDDRPRIARHGHAVLHDGQAGRRRDQRHADAVPEEGHRHGVRAGGADRAGHRVRDRHPRPPRQGARRADAVLQATEELTMYPPT
jgi:aminomethyltransferase